MSPVANKVRGVLRAAAGQGKFRHARIAPSESLSGVVQHFWSVRWDLPGEETFTPQTLPHPNVHLVFAPTGGEISGVHTGRFTARLKGQGRVFGVKFRPGAFRPFLGRSVATLKDRTIPIRSVFGAEGGTLDRNVRNVDSDADKAVLVESFLRACANGPDAKVRRVGQFVDEIAEERDLIKVEQLVDRWGISKRSLQLLFNEYVGVGPKWVIGRYRLHEALERLHEGERLNCTQLAIDLGYFDQAHFIRDFRKLVGCAPATYARRLMDS